MSTRHTTRRGGWAARIAAAALGLGLAAGLGAGRVEAQPHPHGPHAMNPEEGARRLERMQALRTLKLGEVLQAEPKTLEAVDGALRSWDGRILAKALELGEATRALRRALRRGATEAEYAKLTDTALRLRKELDALRYGQYEAAAKPLPAAERARLLLFLPQFERKAHKLLKGRRGADPLDDEDDE